MLGLILGAILVIIAYIVGSMVSIAKASEFPLWVRLVAIGAIIAYIGIGIIAVY